MDLERIKNNVSEILRELPAGVDLVAAAKTRTADEILAAVEAGVGIIGENYLQEAAAVRVTVGDRVKWHFIGHLQKNKVKKAVDLFDLIETVDSVDIAVEIDKRSRSAGRMMPVFIEINSAEESQKTGVLPRDAYETVCRVSELSNIKVCGLMTMGPFSEDPEHVRPFFANTRIIFEKIRDSGIPNTEMRYLSMGMTDSYKVAIEEGANMVRIGTKIFGERDVR